MLAIIHLWQRRCEKKDDKWLAIALHAREVNNKKICFCFFTCKAFDENEKLSKCGETFCLDIEGAIRCETSSCENHSHNHKEKSH